MTPPSISIAICTRNRPDKLARCLASLAPLRDRALELIVVDNASDGDATRKVAESSGARYLLEPEIGVQFARNRALIEAAGDIIAFTDDDCEAGDGWLDAITMAFSDPLVGAVTGQAISAKEANWVQRRFNDYSRGFCVPEPYEVTHETAGGIYYRAVAGVGANMAFRRGLLVRLGGVPAACHNSEDDYMLACVVRAGYKVRYTPESVVYQMHRSRMLPTIARMFEYGMGAMRVLWLMSAEDGSFPLFALNVLWVLYYSELRQLMRSVIRLRPWHTLFSMASLAGFFAGLFIPWGWRAHMTGRLPARGGHSPGVQFRRQALPVLMYHRIGPARPGTYPTLTVLPGRFEKQLGWLRRNGYTAIGTADLAAWLTEGKPLPERPVMITFDDAYEELADYAFPALETHGFTATVFVVTGEIGGANSWDSGSSAPIGCMSREQILRWSGRGIGFGAHSRTHPDLTALPASMLEDETAGSGQDLACVLGAFPESFAYPYGYYDDTVRASIEKDFRLAFTCDEGLNAQDTGPHLLRRTMVRPEDTMHEFGLRVRLGYNPFEDLRARLPVRAQVRAALGIARGN